MRIRTLRVSTKTDLYDKPISPLNGKSVGRYLVVPAHHRRGAYLQAVFTIIYNIGFVVGIILLDYAYNPIYMHLVAIPRLLGTY
jgi:hypothetical protein